MAVLAPGHPAEIFPGPPNPAEALHAAGTQPQASYGGPAQQAPMVNVLTQLHELADLKPNGAPAAVRFPWADR